MSAYPHAEFGWLTDCGTLFDRKYDQILCLENFTLWRCLHHLLKGIDAPNVAAVTGRQRVMSPSHQEAESEGIFFLIKTLVADDWIGLVSRFLRHVQRADFELSFGATMGGFALFGFLPVLPGSCNQLAYSHAKVLVVFIVPPTSNIVPLSTMTFFPWKWVISVWSMPTWWLLRTE